MKTLTTLAILATALTSGFATVTAQEPVLSPTPAATPAAAPSNKSSYQPISTATPTPAGSPSPAPALSPTPTPGPTLEEPQALPPLPLMPQTLPNQAAPPPSAQSALPTEKKAKGKGAPTPLPLTADQLRENIRLRELTTQVLREEPSVTAMQRTADQAKTFEGRRTALRNYNTLLYTKIEKLDPTLHDLVEQILYIRLYALEQHRVRPAKLLEPIPVLPGSHSEDHLSGRVGAALLPAPAPTPTPAVEPGQNPSFLEMQ